MKTALVTGSAGLIGSEAVRFFAEAVLRNVFRKGSYIAIFDKN